MRISTIEQFKSGLDDILKQSTAASQLREKIALQKKIISPKDDPIGATSALTIKNFQANLEQFDRNANSAITALNIQEKTLDNMTKNLLRINELAVQVGNGSLKPSDREAVALEIEERLGSLIDKANAQDADGNYLFAGSKGNVKPIARDANGQFIYQGDEGMAQTRVGQSTMVTTTDTGKSVFFDIINHKIEGSSSTNLYTQTTSVSGLQASGSLSTLDQNDLILNNYLISPAISDGVSSTDATASSLAIANAINANTSAHGVHANAEANVYNLGTITAAALGAGEFTLNGVAITDGTGTESSMIAAINNAQTQTGVVATQPGGPGTDVILTAQDGRNLQLTTAGGATASFSNFDLTAGAQDEVQRAALTLRDHSPIEVGGANPSDVGLSLGSVAISSNTGTGTISSASVVTEPVGSDKSYSIVFNAGGSSFDIIDDDNPTVPLSGFDDVPYVAGQDIEFEGIRVSISGVPNAGDVFGVELHQDTYQDIFTTLQDLIQTARTSGGDNAQLSYELGVSLSNLEQTITKLSEQQAVVGSRRNVIDSQVNANKDVMLLTQDTLKGIEDLDYAAAVSELAHITMALEAAQQSYIKIQSLSLFNYIR